MPTFQRKKQAARYEPQRHYDSEIMLSRGYDAF